MKLYLNMGWCMTYTIFIVTQVYIRTECALPTRNFLKINFGLYKYTLYTQLINTREWPWPSCGYQTVVTRPKTSEPHPSGRQTNWSMAKTIFIRPTHHQKYTHVRCVHLAISLHIFFLECRPIFDVVIVRDEILSYDIEITQLHPVYNLSWI